GTGGRRLAHRGWTLGGTPYTRMKHIWYPFTVPPIVGGMTALTQAPERTRIRPWPALIAAYAGVFLTISDLVKVLVAVPAIERALHASPAVGQLVLAGFQLTYAVTLVTGGRLGDRYGRRRMFCAGVALFTVASVASGLAPD